METEYEAKFLSIDIEELRNKLKSINAELQVPMRLMRRYVFDDDETGLQYSDSFVRLRDEGKKVTLTYKSFSENSVDGASEIEIVVDDFDKTKQFLEKVGLHAQSFQESKRETWVIEGVKVEIDEWPWVNPYVEIEGTSEESVKKVASKLDFDWKNAVFGDVTSVYCAEFDVEPAMVGRNKSVKFNENPPADWKRL